MSAGTPPMSSRLPKIVHPASQVDRGDHHKMAVEARRLSSASPRVGSRSRPHSCPEMSIDHLIGSSRMSRLRHRTCSARQQRSALSGGNRLSSSLTVDEVSIIIEVHETRPTLLVKLYKMNDIITQLIFMSDWDDNNFSTNYEVYEASLHIT